MEDQFLVKLLDCMFFTTFVTERGPPWRIGDLWDDLYANISELLRTEQNDSTKLRANIQVNVTKVCPPKKTNAYKIFSMFNFILNLTVFYLWYECSLLLG